MSWSKGSKLEQAGRLERAESELGGWRELGASWSEGSKLGGRQASFSLLPPRPLAPCPPEVVGTPIHTKLFIGIWE